MKKGEFRYYNYFYIQEAQGVMKSKKGLMIYFSSSKEQECVITQWTTKKLKRSNKSSKHHRCCPLQEKNYVNTDRILDIWLFYKCLYLYVIIKD